MRHKYETPGIVIARTAHGEANADIYIVTPEFGLLRARAQGIRKPGAKLAGALQTFSESDVVLVRGKDTWRIAGATLVSSWSGALPPDARVRAGKVAALLLRLLHGETNDASAFRIFRGLLVALPFLSDDEQEAAECLAVLRLLKTLGLDEGVIPGDEDTYDTETLAVAHTGRIALVSRINRGLSASGF